MAKIIRIILTLNACLINFKVGSTEGVSIILQFLKISAKYLYYLVFSTSIFIFPFDALLFTRKYSLLSLTYLHYI